MRYFNKLLISLLLFFFAVSASAEESYSFAVVPQQTAAKLARLWSPLLQYLSQSTGYIFKFKTAPDIPSFERRLSRGTYDFAYMNPFHYTLFSQTPGYRAFAKEKDKYIQGIIVVHKDAPYTKIDELAEQSLAFPAPAAFAATLLPRAYFLQAGINTRAVYVSSHDSVYRTVARGLYPAGGGVMRTFNSADVSVQQQLRILWRSQKYTPHAFAAHPRVNKKVVEKLAQALLSLSSEENIEEILRNLNITGLESAQDKDWDDVRALHLENLNIPLGKIK